MTLQAQLGYKDSSLAERLVAAQLPPPAERRSVREKASLSKSQIAAELGVLPITVARWERGTTKPQFRHAVAYGRLLAELRKVSAVNEHVVDLADQAAAA